MRILLKFGSALISRNNRLNVEWLTEKVNEIALLHKENHEIVLVSSGAVAAGMESIGLKDRPKETIRLQFLSGIGQIKLMKQYKDLFKEKGIFISQVLLTHHNFSSKDEVVNIREIIELYLKEYIIPIINENDMVNKEEIDYKNSFTDNDILAAIVATNLNVDLAVILTDVNGLYNTNPKKDPNAKLIKEVASITKEIKKHASNETNSLGLGGMLSKIKAVELITKHGIAAIIGNGYSKINDLISGNTERTYFKAD